MNISDTFIRRPIATSLLMLAIGLFGMVAYRSLPVSDLPNVDFPTLLVTANLPGASPETMASSVATPLENNFSMIAGLESMTSSNSLGSTQITLEFNLSRNLDGAAVDVQAAITQSARIGRTQKPLHPRSDKDDRPTAACQMAGSSGLHRQDAYAMFNDRAQRISSSRRASRADAGTAVTAILLPTALKTSME